MQAPADYPGCPVTVTEAIAQGRSLREPRWGIGDALIGLIGFAVIGAVAAWAWGSGDSPAGMLLAVGLPWIALAGWPLLVTWWRGNGPRIDLGLRLTWSDVGWGAIFGLASLFTAGVAAVITLLFSPDLNSAAGELADQLRDSGPRWTTVVLAMMLLVGAPIVEEIFFRGLLFSALRKQGLGTVLTIVVTAVVFAGVHLEPLRFLVLLPTGLLLGVVRWKTGSTGASMFAHAMVNAPGALVLLYGIPSLSPTP